MFLLASLITLDISDKRMDMSSGSFFLFSVQSALASAAQLQHLHTWFQAAFVIKPWKPACFVCGNKFCAGRCGRKYSLRFDTGFLSLFYPCEVNQLQHSAPVNGMIFFQRCYRTVNSLFHKLHLFNPILNKLFCILRELSINENPCH